MRLSTLILFVVAAGVAASAEAQVRMTDIPHVVVAPVTPVAVTPLIPVPPPITSIPPTVHIAPPPPGTPSPEAHSAHPTECRDVWADTNGDGVGDKFLGCFRS